MAVTKGGKERAGSVVAEGSVAAAARNDDSSIKHDHDVTLPGCRSALLGSRIIASSPVMKEDPLEETKAVVKQEDGSAEISSRRDKRSNTPVKQEESLQELPSPDLARIKADLALDETARAKRLSCASTQNESAKGVINDETAKEPGEPGVHPFSLAGPDFLALCLVTPDRHIVWHEQHLHQLVLGSGSHPWKDPSHEQVQNDVEMHLKTLAEKHGLSLFFLRAVYMHQREKHLSSPLATRFSFEDEEDVAFKDFQESSSKICEIELQKHKDKIESQMKPLNLIMHYLRMRVNGLSRP